MLIALLLAVSMLTFGAMNLLGDPLFNILGPVAGDTENPENIAKIQAAKEQFYLDRPLPERYVRWLGDFVTGDFGVRFSASGQPPVSEVIKERLPRTLTLAGMAMTFTLAIGIPWGVWSGSRSETARDRLSTGVAFFFVAMPNFALAVVLYYVVGIQLGWLPLRFDAGAPFWQRMHQLVLPALTLALGGAAVYQRLLRTDMITTLQEDFILMARAKGLSRRHILFRHALRPSLFSVVTLFGINAGAVFSGALIVELIFGIPGVGSLFVESIFREDFPVVLALVMILTAAFVVMNFVIDILYSVIDPRVRQ
jgi:peptide/nickel transport system permease protein